MLTAIFIISILILVIVAVLAIIVWKFTNNYEEAEITKIKMLNLIKKELVSLNTKNNEG